MIESGMSGPARIQTGQRSRAALIFAAVSLAVMVAGGCSSHPSDQQVQQQAAQTTQQVKQGAQQAAATARVAAANAEDKINAVAAGVKEGMQSGPAASTVNINSATRDQLVALPGISSAKAAKIIAGRPYSAPNDLVTKNILSQTQFDKLSPRLKAE